VAELGKIAQDFLKFLFDLLGPGGGVVAVFAIYLGWRLWRAELRIEALSDKLFAVGDRSTDRLSSIAGEGMNADLAVAKALEELADQVQGLPRGRGRCGGSAA
jgi:hypothetical protein